MLILALYHLHTTNCLVEKCPVLHGFVPRDRTGIMCSSVANFAKVIEERS